MGAPRHISKIDDDVKTCWTRCNKLIKKGELPIKLYGVLAELSLYCFARVKSHS